MPEAAAGLMTVEQYCELPEPGSFYYELHHGKLIQLSWPKMGEILVRGRLRDQLDLALDKCGIVITRLPFRALPEYELRVADVGYIARGRWEQTKDEDYFFGAPDLIIETRRSLSALKMVAASSGWSTHPFAGSRYRRPMA